NVPVMIEKLMPVFFNKAGPAEFSRYRAYFIVRRFRTLVSHFEKQQICQLLNVISVAHAVVPKDVTVVPELLDDCRGSHFSTPTSIFLGSQPEDAPGEQRQAVCRQRIERSAEVPPRANYL